jgi:class 3 adenylate cyclase
MSRSIEREWTREFTASAAELWPVIADTARFNEAAGLPRYTVTDLPQPDGSVRRIGGARRFGLTLNWTEGIPQWVAGRRFEHHRLFTSGPVRRVVNVIDFEPAAGKTRVRYRVAIEPRGWFAGLLLRFLAFDQIGRIVDRLFREAEEFLEGSRERAYRAVPPKISPAVRETIIARAQRLSERGYGMATRLAGHLLEAPETDLERMRPRVLAKQWQAEPRAVTETCLAAARDGLLMLRWDLLCPRCRGAKVSVTSLDQLPQGAHCPSCNIDYGRDFSRNVEVTFEPDPALRPLGTGTYCLISPVASEHIKVQQVVGAAAYCDITVPLVDGEYRARTVEPGGSAEFRVENGQVPEIALDCGGAVVIGAATACGHARIRNHGPKSRTVVIEDRAWAKDALTAHEVTTMQAFRDLFADAVLRPGDQVQIRRVALMFTDIRGSSALYNRVGDARAYSWVREHYAVLTGAVREHDGAVVKTIGDAVMAAFSSPANGLAAALAICERIAEFDQRLKAETGAIGTIQVKIGLHCGPCIAVTLNDRLDYFGQTVNLAARLQGESRGGDIVISEAMASEPELSVMLAELTTVVESATVKGFPEMVALRRIALAPDRAAVH